MIIDGMHRKFIQDAPIRSSNPIITLPDIDKKQKEFVGLTIR